MTLSRGQVVHLVQGQRQFNHAQIGREVTADAGNGLDQAAAQLIRKRLEAIAIQGFQVLRPRERVQKGVTVHESSSALPAG
jgi:hypothetical protein